MKNGFFTAVLFLTACTAQQVQPTPTLLSVPVFVSLPTKTTTPTSIPSPTLEPTLMLYQQYSIDYLRARPYGGGMLDAAEVLYEHQNFTTYSGQYQSDGL